jgi:hypothetical protein
MSQPVNIGPRGIRQRGALGAMALVSGAGVALALIARQLPAPWLVAVAPLFWLGSLGVLQARAKT